MCYGVHYQVGEEERRVVFPNPYAQLPVIKRSGEIQLVAWGRRKEQEQGILPVTGWARIESVRAGRWDRYFPKPVKIPALSYQEKTHSGESRTYELIPSQFIQGLLARDGHLLRVYVVTRDASLSQEHDRLPRIVSEMDKYSPNQSYG